MVATIDTTSKDAARLLRRYEKKLPKLDPDRRRRLVAAVASDLEQKHSRSSLRAA